MAIFDWHRKGKHCLCLLKDLAFDFHAPFCVHYEENGWWADMRKGGMVLAKTEDNLNYHDCPSRFLGQIWRRWKVSLKY